MSKWSCSEPYNSVYLEQTQSGLQIGPCCVAKKQPYDHNHDLHSQPYLQDIKQQFNNNIVPAACNSCAHHEQNGYKSRRQSSGQEPIHNKLKKLEIHVGNYCNLKCIICNNGWSSAWRKDAEAMGLPTYDNFKFDPTSIHADLSAVEWLHFNGGEPLLTNIHLDVLGRIPNPSQCIVYYNTNGTIRVNPSVFEIWSKFKLVKLMFSIDDIGTRFNYQRTNADWKEVESNMFWYRETSPINMMFGINRTISKLNQPYLSELEYWFAEYFATNRLGDPNDFSEQLANGKTALDSKTYKDYISQLDAIRS